jgi:hypothetical protein
MKTLIDVNKVYQVYSGKNNRCCCGCSGKYSVSSAHREYASKNCGYSLTLEDCNDRTVKMIVNKMNKSPDTEWLNAHHATLVVGERLYMAIQVVEK